MCPQPAHLRAALYARVSSERQAEENTIASQLEALRRRLLDEGFPLDDELCFLDEGCSGTTLLRPQLERLRDQVALGSIDRLYVLSPDRLARNFAHQVVLLDEFHKAGVEVHFLNQPLSQSPEDLLLLQVQGVIAEYERAKIMERIRRGKQYAARQGRLSVLPKAPYGYRYVRVAEGAGEARFDVVAEEAAVVRQIFRWIGCERLALREICRRLEQQGIRSRTGKRCWDATAISYMLRNTAYIGQAVYGKTRVVAPRRRLRAVRGKPEVPRRPHAAATDPTCHIVIAVPALVSEELFAQAAQQLAQNRCRVRQGRKPGRHLLAGLVVCRQCGYALCGTGRKSSDAAGAVREYGYYRCTGHQMRNDKDERLCRMRSLRTTVLETAVWDDVCGLLREPGRLQQEYERRRQHSQTEATQTDTEGLTKRLAAVKKSISRLIDAYTEGLLEKEEFEPRLCAVRERQARLETELQAEQDAATRRAELSQVIGKLQEFAEEISSRLDEASWATRREVICALIKQIEIGDEEIHIVYRVPPVPFVERPEGGVLQHCENRQNQFNVIVDMVGQR